MTKRRPHHTPTVRTLEVSLNSTLVGTLTHLGNESVVFAFAKSYLDAGPERPTLSLAFKAADGTLISRPRSSRVRLTPFFSNLLPEGHVRTYLAEQGAVHPDREFFLLWLLGTDLPGAVRIRSVDGSVPPASERETTRVRGARQPLRFSLAGVQLKFSALMERTKGLTLPVDGTGGNWIVKLPSPRYPAVPENEYAMMTLAAAVGLDVPEVRLVPTSEIDRLPGDLPEAFGQSLAVRRFDRPKRDVRVHMEDFAQVFGVYPEQKYDKASYGNIARVLWFEAGEDAIVELTRRLTFNALIGNAEAHLKNWSILYRDGRQATLAPAYDLVSTIPYIADEKMALSIGGTAAFDRLDVGHFLQLADRVGLPGRLVIQTVRETAAKVRDLWPSHEPRRALPDRLRRAVDAHLGTIRV